MHHRTLLFALALTFVLWGAVLSIRSVPVQANSGCPATYIVQRGDWLAAIARRYNTTVYELVQLNPKLYWRPDVIYPGEKLCVPSNTPIASNFSVQLQAEYTIARDPNTPITMTLNAPMNALGKRIELPLVEPDSETFILGADITGTQKISATLTSKPAPALLVMRNDRLSPDFTLFEVGSSAILSQLRPDPERALSLGSNCEARSLQEAYGTPVNEPMSLTAWLENDTGERFPYRITKVGVAPTATDPNCFFMQGNPPPIERLGFALIPSNANSYRIVLYAYRVDGPCFRCIVRYVCRSFGRHGRYVCSLSR